MGGLGGEQRENRGGEEPPTGTWTMNGGTGGITPRTEQPTRAKRRPRARTFRQLRGSPCSPTPRFFLQLRKLPTGALCWDNGKVLQTQRKSAAPTMGSRNLLWEVVFYSDAK